MDIKKSKILLIPTTAALMISLVLTGSAAAAEGFKISAARIEGGAGSQATVIITAERAKGSEGGQFTLTFDQSLVKPVSIEPGDLVLSAGSNLDMANLDYAPGELIFMWVTANADTKDSGVVCKVTFYLLKEGTTAIAFKDLIIVAETGDLASSTAGQIKIGPEASGEEPVTDPGQDTEPEEDPESGEADVVEEVIGQDDAQGETEFIAEQDGINPIIVVVPITIIVILAVVYYLVKKSGKKKIKNKS